jgi:hypothetical protein
MKRFLIIAVLTAIWLSATAEAFVCASEAHANPRVYEVLLYAILATYFICLFSRKIDLNK